MASKQTIPKRPWSDIEPRPVLLVTGPEHLFADRAWQQVRGQLKQIDPGVEIHEFEAAHYEPGSLLTLASPSLFGEPRLIRVSGVEKANDAFITEAKAYLQHPDPDTTLFLRHGGGVRGKALLDAIRKGDGQGIEIVCPEVKAGDIPALIRDEFRRLGVPIDQRAIGGLSQAFTDNVEELVATCQQLAATSPDGVTLSQVEVLTGGRVETSAFAVADAAIAGDAAAALLALRQAFDTGVAPIPLLGAINYKVKAMARVYGLHGSSGEIAKQIGMSPWQVGNTLKDLRAWKEEGLARVMVSAAETDLKLKGGARNPEFALEQYVLLIARRGQMVAK